MKQKKNILNIRIGLYLVILFILLFFILGMYVGAVLQQEQFIKGAVLIAEGLEGTTFNIEIDLNETLMIDKVTENIKPMFWDIRMQNCTKTEKG